MNQSTLKKIKFSPGLIGRVLLLLCAGLALYLASISLTQTTLLGCTEQSECFQVLGTRWAYLFGLPASFPAIAIYLVAVLAAGAFEARDQRTWLGTLGEISLLLSAVAAIWFLSLQFFVIKHFCMLCCLTHVFALCGVFFLMWSRRLQPWPDDTEEDWAEAPVLRRTGLFAMVRALAVAVGVIALAAGPFVNASHPFVTATLSVDKSEEPATGVPILTYDDGKIAIHPSELPLLGKPGAREFALALTDYTCDYCRLYHSILEEVAQTHGDQFAIVLLPAARDDNAALLQHTMLCLFRADPEKHRTLSAEIIAGNHPALGEAVRLTARALLGEAAWSAAEQAYGPWASKQIQLARDLRAANQKTLSSTRLPQLVAGPHVLLGYSDNLAEINQFVENGLHPDRQSIAAGTPAPSEVVHPVLSLRSPFQDLGMVEGGQVIPCKVQFKNTGSSDLEVKFVALDYDCELVSLPSGPIAKGDSGEIELLVSAPKDATSFQRRLKIHTNAEPPTMLLLQGRVHQVDSQTSVP